MNFKTIVVVGLLMLAFVSFNMKSEPTPAPPPPASELNLQGKFVGSEAAADAIILGELCRSIAECIEADGMLEKPRLATGRSLDDLRRAAREYALDGRCLTDEQPAVAEAVGNYMEAKIGTNGGPVSPQVRSSWVAAFREVARSCEIAIQ